MDTVLEIKVDNILVKVKEFTNFGGVDKFFATGYDGNLYALHDYDNPSAGYRLLSNNFVEKVNSFDKKLFDIVEYKYNFTNVQFSNLKQTR